MDLGQKKAHHDAILRLLQQARLGPDEIATRVKQALSLDYWRSLNPKLSVNQKIVSGTVERAAIAPRHLHEIAIKLGAEGYFQLEPLLDETLVERMRETIVVLKKADWPPVFAFVYDEFWQVARSPSLVRLLSSHLGAGYRPVPHIWGHYVPPQGGVGWRPHIDSGHQSRRLTVWVALSDATLEGSCMFLIPKNLVPSALADNFSELKTVGIGDVQTLLKNSRPLPVRAGAVLGWEHNVIHWGGLAWQTSAPRISISMEFIAENLAPASDEHPILDAHQLPDFAERLQVIGKAIVAYEPFEPLLIRYLELAQQLVADEIQLVETCANQIQLEPIT
jgi:hypothetical protein